MRGLGRVRAVAHQVQTSVEAWRRAQWQRKMNPSGASTPIFLVGNGRSGTSMLVFHLTRSWCIDLYNEDNPAAFEQWFLRDFATIDHLIAESPAPIVLLKPIKDTYQIRNLQAHYPASKVLFACRHFDDVINSSVKRFYVDYGGKIGKTVNEITPPIERWMADDFAEYHLAPPPVATKRFLRELWRDGFNLESKIAFHWLFVNSLFFDFGLDQDETVRLVQYESLVSRPAQEFRAICDFMSIPFDEQMVADVFSSSISKKKAPELDTAVREACEAVWQRLCQHSDQQS